jgi:hypothetical protein
MPAPSGAIAEQMRTVWGQAADLTKQRVVNPTLYRALEKTVAIAWEDETFVVGVNGADGLMTGALNTSEYRVVIEKALQDVTRNPKLRYRFIEGSEYADWEHTKQRDAALQATQVAAAQKQAATATAVNSWDDLHDNVARLWSQSDSRSTATGRGRFLVSALNLVSEAMDKLYPVEGKPGDAVERGLSRVVERVASTTQSDPAVIAYLLFEKRGKSGGG